MRARVIVDLGVFADFTSIAIFGHDDAFRITTWNRGAERIFGYAPDEIAGECLKVLVPPHLHDDLERVQARVASGERVERAFTEIRRKDGMPIPVALSSSAIGGDGQFGGAIVVVQELTEIRLAQAALAEVEQRFRDWESLAHVGRWLWDVGTDAVQWSEELHRMHGVDPRDFDGTLDAHLAVVHVDDRDRIRAQIEAAVASGLSFDDEYRVVGSDGETKWFAMRAEPTVGSAGDVVGVRGVSQAMPLTAARR